MLTTVETEDCIKDATTGLEIYQDHVRLLPGTCQNIGEVKPQFLKHKFFKRQKCSKQVKKVNQSILADQIEDDPMTIDIKIDGIDKIKNVPLDIVGVFSYPSYGLCSHEGAELKEPINVIVNINAVDKKHNISIES